MTDSLALLQDLLPELAAYLPTAPAGTVADFAQWLHQRTAAAPPLADPPAQEPAFLNRMDPLMQLGPLVSRLQYFSHQQAQQLLAGLVPGLSVREFIVLAAITNNQTPTKSEIASLCLLELSTITEVTRRLTQAGLISEVPDAHDRRIRRLATSPAGQHLWQQASVRLAPLYPSLYSALSASEQTELRRLLGKVNAHLTSEWQGRGPTS